MPCVLVSKMEFTITCFNDSVKFVLKGITAAFTAPDECLESGMTLQLVIFESVYHIVMTLYTVVNLSKASRLY